MKQHELARALNIESSERRSLRKALQSLEEAGKVACLRKNRWALPDTSRTLIGDLSVHPDGYGFVAIPGSAEPDLFIPARHMGCALHGDRVQVERSVSRVRGRRPKGATPTRAPLASPSTTGRVVRVVERKLLRTAGIYKVTPHYAYVIPDNTRINQNIRVQQIAPESRRTVRDNHRVVVELLPWDSPTTPIPGRVIEDLGPADAPGVEMLSLLRSHGLDESFPKKVELASRAIGPHKADDPIEPGRRDLRHEWTFTIDPEDARDFDDAVSLVRLPDHRWQLSVHIADVASYVEADSVVDKEAVQRGNSVYLVDRVITMLPRHLTENVCSLQPETDRRAHTVRMTLSARGACTAVETFPSVIRSAQRLTYEQVQAHIVDRTPPDGPPEVAVMLTDMDQLAKLLRTKRERHGSILFEMPEVRCVLDAEGQVTGILPRRAFRAYHLIEEFMLMANQSVAHLIAKSGFPAPYRIHAPPDEEQWERIQIDLASLHIQAQAETREDLNAIATEYAGTPLAHIVNLAMLRNLNRAMYSADREEHFGLSFSHYVHFTSPIRRYPDLIVHRVLKAIEENAPPPYSKEEISRLADHCSQTEREAADAEQESVTLKRIDFYAREQVQGRIGPFPALVTSMNGKGLLVELTETLQRGLVPFSLLRQDHYHVNEHRTQAIGRRSRHTWQIGDTLDVEIVRVDTARKLIDFRPAAPPAAAPSAARGRSGRKRQRIK